MDRSIGPAARGALTTAVTLLGGLALGLAAGSVTFGLLPGSSITQPRPVHMGLAAVPALAGFLGGSALWAVRLGSLGGRPVAARRLALAGMLGFAPITLVLALLLGALEPVLVGGLAHQFPIHRVFTLLFVPSAYLIAGVSAASLGLVVGGRGLAWALAWRVGLAAAGAFLVVNLTLEAMGWVVGAPGAAERATMLTVLFAGVLAAALAGGAVAGAWLARPAPAATRPPLPA